MKIKMRTWIDGQFYYWGHIEPNMFAGPVSSSEESLSIEEIMDRTQMFIGSPDKSGTELWEGDIVKASHPAGGTLKGTIEYDEELAGYVLKRGEEEILNRIHLYEFDEFEIIGNIFENPVRKPGIAERSVK